MAQFNIHFFKEKSRNIDLEYLIAFFENIEGFKMEMDDDSVRFLYHDDALGFDARFVITPKSQVPSIYRLNPRFLDVNFHLEIPILLPDYCAKKVFDLVKKITETFHFYIYNEFFEDVLLFKSEIVLKAFNMVKEAYMDRNPVILRDFYMLNKEKSMAVFRYMDDLIQLHKYYRELETYVPRYDFLVTDEHDLKLSVEWRETSLTVFPPFLDYVMYRQNNETRIIKFSDLYEVIGKYLQDVPGFLKGTRVIPAKLNKKVSKLMKKAKFERVTKTFTYTSLKYLLD